MDPKGMYSIGQLAQLAGLSRFQMRRLLELAHGDANSPGRAARTG